MTNTPNMKGAVYIELSFRYRESRDCTESFPIFFFPFVRLYILIRISIQIQHNHQTHFVARKKDSSFFIFIPFCVRITYKHKIKYVKENVLAYIIVDLPLYMPPKCRSLHFLDGKYTYHIFLHTTLSYTYFRVDRWVKQLTEWVIHYTKG